MPSKKAEPAEGVAPRISNKPDRYAETGVAVAVPKSTAKKAVSKKAGQQANTNEEKD
jgi:hypothetical protein